MKNIKMFENFRDDNKRIQEPNINSVVFHTGWRYENDDNYPCHIYIINGQKYSNGRLSNFWTWKRILPNGDLSKEEHNYGSFMEPFVDMHGVYTEEEIKKLYPKKYQEYLIKKDANKYNL